MKSQLAIIPAYHSAVQERIERMRRELPYGIWTCRDGREVLFNRKYQPLLTRAQCDAPAFDADPREWVEDICEQSWFYSDRNPPYFNKATKARCEAILREWRASVPRRADEIVFGELEK